MGASTVVRPILQRKCACGQHTGGGGQCAECSKQKAVADHRASGMLQRRTDAFESAPNGAHELPSVVHDVLRSPGQPLDTATRSFFEPRFQENFSEVPIVHPSSRVLPHALSVSPEGGSLEQEAEQIAQQVMRSQGMPATSRGQQTIHRALADVRVHADLNAARSASTLNAAAYTFGRDIVFGAGRYSPSTRGGRELLAHELGHALRHSDGRGTSGKIMRKVTVPSDKDLETDIDQLRGRLGKLTEQEVAKGQSNPETDLVREKLAWRESLAAEPDPIRKQIVFYRGALQDLRHEIAAAPPSSQRDEVARKIAEHEAELAKALRANIQRLDTEIPILRSKFSASDPASADVGKTILAREAELSANQAELKTLERVFSPSKAAEVSEKYKKEVRPLPGGGCMTAVYKGLEALYTPSISAETEKKVQSDARKILKKTKEDTNNVDRIMETLRANSLAGTATVCKYSQKLKAWVPDVEKTVLSMVSPIFLGWYFFGLSVSGAYHSVILAVDNSEGGTPQVYWMDQYSKGFTNNVTGKVLAALKVDWLHPHYGFADTTIWPLIPKPEAAVEVP
jgi:hypothetical protein